jgi:hypothetical protein
MNRPLATLLVASLGLAGLETAACAPARAAEPFEEMTGPPASHESHRLAYASLIVGAGLIGGSFAIAHQAQDTYDDYLKATDPGRIEELYDRTVLYDRFASGSLLAGEALVVTGIYLRFLRSPPMPRVSVRLGTGACALSVRF